MSLFSLLVIFLLTVIATSASLMANERYIWLGEKLFYRIVAKFKPLSVGDLLYEKWCDRYRDEGATTEKHVTSYIKILQIKKDYYVVEHISTPPKKNSGYSHPFDSHIRKYRVHRDYKLSVKTVNNKKIEDFFNDDK